MNVANNKYSNQSSLSVLNSFSDQIKNPLSSNQLKITSTKAKTQLNLENFNSYYSSNNISSKINSIKNSDH
jgi:hypothetical protein